MKDKDAVIKSLRKALALATNHCVDNDLPKMNQLQFLSLVNGAIADANEVIGENVEVEYIRKRWVK